MEFNVQAALACVSAITFVAHSVYVIFFKWYISTLDNMFTIGRWVEFSLSAPIMMLTIAVMSGIRDRAALVLISCVMLTVILSGAVMQLVPDKALYTCVAGFVLLTVAFAQVWVSFDAYDLPAVVKGIVFSMSFLFASFGFPPLIAIIYNKSVRFVEINFNILSLTAKVILNVMFAVYAKMRESDDIHN